MSGRTGIGILANPSRRPIWVLAAALLVALHSAIPAAALSEIAPDTNPPPAEDQVTPRGDSEIQSVPLPDIVRPPAGPQAAPDPASPATPASPEEQAEPDDPQLDPNAPLPEVIYDLSRLPAPVRRMRELILEAAVTGDLEKLRPLIGLGDDVTQLSLGGIDGDAIAYLKELSGDGEGQEILAILSEVLEAGYVHMDAGSQNELYVWPYFFAVPLERLTPAQRVELFRIVTAGDYEEMKTYGAYIFYRVGITPEGRWQFFVAGD